MTNTTLVPPAAGTHDFATVVGSVLSAGTVAPPLTLSIASIVRVLTGREKKRGERVRSTRYLWAVAKSRGADCTQARHSVPASFEPRR